MKRTLTVLLVLLVAASVSFAEVTLSISGSSTLEWGFSGQLIDNSGEFAGKDVPSFYTDDSGKHKWGPKDAKLTLTVTDEDEMTIVTAESKVDLDIKTETDGDNVVPVDTNLEDAFQYIEFPNVVAGTLGIKLIKADKLSTSVTAVKSNTKVPNALFTVTPVEGVTAKLGLAIDIGELDKKFYGATPTLDYKIEDPTYTAGTNEAVADTFAGGEQLIEITTTATDQDPTIDFVYASYTAFATSIYGEYMLSMSDTDSVTVGVGTVIDTAYMNSVYDTDAAADYVVEKWGPKNIVAVTATADTTKNQVYGFATFPIGVAVDAAIADATVGVDFQTRMVQGADTDNFTSAGNYQDYVLPFYLALDAGYSLAMGDMTVAPSLAFKYSSDFWKWGLNKDGDGFEYKGDVSAADFLGRPMSVGVGVDVTGIAGLLDVDLSADFGLGDAEANHGLESSAGSPGFFDASLATTLYETTISDQLTRLDKALTDTANVNDDWFSTNGMVYKIALGLEATPVDNVTVTNDTSYSMDGLGLEGAKKGAQFGNWLSKLENKTGVAYDIVAGETTAATLFGNVTYTQLGYEMERGSVYDTSAKPWTEEDTEQEGKTTLDYELGVKVTVSF